MAATDAMAVPKKNTAYRHYFVILDADGDPVSGATALDSEVSIDGAAFADCTNEATEIGSSGFYYLDLTSSEMNGDAICVRVQTSTSGAKTEPIILYPEEAGDIRVNVTQISGDATSADNLESYTDGTTPMPVNVTQVSGDATAADNLELDYDGTGYAKSNSSVGSIDGNVGGDVLGEVVGGLGSAGGINTFDDLIADKDDEWGALAASHSGTAQAGAATTITLAAGASATDDLYTGQIVFLTTGTGAGQARRITDYVGATKVATVATWATNPSTDTTYEILPDADSTGGSGLDAAGVRAAVGLSSANLDTQLSTIDTNVDSILVDTGTTLDGKLDTIDTNVDSILADTGTDGVVVNAAGLASDAVTEIVTAVLTTAMTESYSTDGGALTIAQALHEIVQHLQAHAINSTTWTIYKRDGVTSAFTLTLSDATSPTSSERAT